MLHEFLTENRQELVERCRAKVALRSPGGRDIGLQQGIALFQDQLIRILRAEQDDAPGGGRRVPLPSAGYPRMSEMGDSAVLHARELLRHGYSVEEVVYDYGDLCQSITDLAFEQGAEITTDEFRSLNRCLDNVIAVAVTEFAHQRDSASAERHAVQLNERLGFLAHELRNQLTTATLAFGLIQSGKVALSGAMGAVLNRSLLGLRSLIDHSLAEVRIAAGLPDAVQTIALPAFLAELRITASLEAEASDCTLRVEEPQEDLVIRGDRDLLLAAAGNLLQNAFKFTRPGTEVRLQTRSVGGRILIEVSDHCGGLPAGVADSMFGAFAQHGADRSGLGLGLSIAKRSVEAAGGTLAVRDAPGHGCTFTIDLPRLPVMPASQSAPA